jgi:para-aminobenzoate synthetase/4-amino-4-deoxychorismate lyase
LGQEAGQKAAMQVILDGPAGRLGFARPRAVIRADSAAEVEWALAALEQARADGKWLAGAFAYELGYALEARLAPLMPASANGPLLAFGVYDQPSTDMPLPAGRAYAGPLTPEWDEAAYGRRFRAVKEAIAAGDMYQANLSFRSRFSFLGDPLALYEKLRASSHAPHCAYLDDGRRQILSLSPELFFAIENGTIHARPMKGTAPRTGTDDAGERARLAASAKDRAENLMIVDLIRNDLSRVAEIGSVAVERLFEVETYPSLHTMVSTVAARLRPDAGIAAIMKALFPCGSVTGAPKIKAMEILRELESSPRDAYCGGIGFFAPTSPAREALAGEVPVAALAMRRAEGVFNVAIRTLTIEGNAGTLGIGGGVVQDSCKASEYAECLLKARFFEAVRRPLALIETMKFDSRFIRLERHLARMAHSARLFGLDFDEASAHRALGSALKGWDGPLRVRLTLDESGAHQATVAPLPPNPPRWSFTLSRAHVQSGDLLLRHKTSWRDLYESEAERSGTDEVLFWNERGEVTEGARSNIFVKRGDRLLTPPVSSGLLPGILRAELIETGQCEEKILTPADLTGEVFFGNSLRGLIAAKSRQEN